MCTKYADQAYGTSTGEKAFKVATQLAMLKELVSGYADISYRIEPKFIDIGQARITVGVTVQIYKPETNAVILEAFGISSRYTYTIESKVKDATTEVAQTVALGKALSLMGFNASPASATYTKDEMVVFEKIADKIDAVSLRTKAANLVNELDEELKKRMRIAGVNLDIILDLVDVNNTTSDQLAKRVRAYMDNPKGSTQSSVK